MEDAMVRARTLLRVLPYLIAVLMISVFLVGTEISSETAAIADEQQALYAYPIDVQVFWLQQKACLVLPPDSYIAKCSNLPLVPVMFVLTVMMIIVLVVYGMLRKRLTLLPSEQKISFRKRRLSPPE